jgi:hypothetical protein
MSISNKSQLSTATSIANSFRRNQSRYELTHSPKPTAKLLTNKNPYLNEDFTSQPQSSTTDKVNDLSSSPNTPPDLSPQPSSKSHNSNKVKLSLKKKSNRYIKKIDEIKKDNELESQQAEAAAQQALKVRLLMYCYCGHMISAESKALSAH